MIQITLPTKIPSDLNKESIEEIVTGVLNKFGIKSNIEIEVLFVGSREIKSLNMKYRRKDEPTDVLSFPQRQFNNTRLNILGSIVICPEVAKERNELLKELLKHGLLHLLGYDHETDPENWNKAKEK